ncbi:MAG TPA: hypothetical protein VNK04_09140 [Gemmataceae bacterium]|nr:hypothetical protein [Gemmataceae bacterium]
MSGPSPLLKAIQDLGNKYPHVRAQAVTALAAALQERGAAPVNEEVRVAVRCLAEHVHEEDEDTAVKACSCLTLTGAAAAAAFPELARACLDKRPAVSMAAATALVKLVKLTPVTRRKGVEVLPVVIKGLAELHDDTLTQLATILRSLEDEAAPLINQLVEEFLLPEPQGTMAKLREKVTGHYHKRRQRCFELLGKVGPAAEPALPTLRQFVQCSDPWLQQQAKACIIRIRRSLEESA